MQGKRIVTLTLNPAVDEHYEICNEADSEARLVERDRGGKGINVSRALYRAGVESTCYIAVGERDMEEFLCGEDISYLDIRAKAVRGGVRTNRHIHTQTGDRVEGGSSAPLTAADLSEIEGDLCELVGDGDILAVCGSLPTGTDTAAAVEMLSRVSRRGVRTIVDCRSLTLTDISKIQPIMIKPNKDEAEQYLGYPVDEGNMRDALRELASLTGADVLLTLGGDGACLCSDGQMLRALSPRVKVKSTTGAGDSTVCAYIIALTRALCPRDTLRLAVAFGTAACEAEGSNPPDPCRVKELLEQVNVEEII